MGYPTLSGSQRAYLFRREKFLAGIDDRAARLWEDGYQVMDDPFTDDDGSVFNVYKDADSDYIVNPVEQTCTCPFHHKQRSGEPLTNDGTIVPCKHQKGLPMLIARQVEWHEAHGLPQAAMSLRLAWEQAQSLLRQRAA